MNKIKIVHTADLHLTNPDLINDRIHRQLASDTLSVFYSIIDFCKEYKPDVLLICGDLFSKPDEEETFAKRVFEKFSEIPSTQVVITPGNHDFLSSSSPFRNTQTQENVYIFRCTSAQFQVLPVICSMIWTRGPLASLTSVFSSEKSGKVKSTSQN